MVSNLNLLESRRRILLNTPHIETISDTIASFETDVATKIKGCKVYFTPIQEGEGDPSPENVRPIHGWDGVTVYTDGKYYADTDKIFDEGVLTGTAEKIIIYDFPVENGTYTVYTDVPNDSSQSIASVFAANGPLRSPTSGGHGVFVNAPRTITVTTGLLSLGIRTGSGTYLIWNKQTFAPYHILVERDESKIDASNKIPISFGRTIYGGYVDLIKGEVVEEYGIASTFSQYRQNNGFIAYCTVVDSESRGNMYCNMIGKYGRFYTANMTGNIIQKERIGGNLYLALDENADVNDLRIVYKHTTPVHYPIDPQTLKALRGMNNIWSDANGNVEVSFYTH